MRLCGHRSAIALCNRVFGPIMVVFVFGLITYISRAVLLSSQLPANGPRPGTPPGPTALFVFLGFTVMTLWAYLAVRCCTLRPIAHRLLPDLAHPSWPRA